MLVSPVLRSVHRAQEGVLPEELEFYQSYDWCLNPHLTVGEAVRHLGEEIDKLSRSCQTVGRSARLQPTYFFFPAEC